MYVINQSDNARNSLLHYIFSRETRVITKNTSWNLLAIITITDQTETVT